MAKADITIHGKQYSVACAPGQERRLIALSRQLDARVEQISNAVGKIGEDRLLLIAALALLDELDAARRGQPSGSDFDITRAAQALSDAAKRIESIAEQIEAGS